MTHDEILKAATERNWSVHFIKGDDAAPWIQSGGDETGWREICRFTPCRSNLLEQLANAALIVRAVNSHEALVEACAAALRCGTLAQTHTPAETRAILESALSLALGE